MQDVRITGIGSYLPRRMLETADLPPLDKPVSEDDVARIGVHRRGWAGEGESIPEMAARAAERALARAGVEAEAIDLLILANWTQRRFIPEFAPKVARILGARRAFSFDVCTACAGFAYGTSIAQSYLRSDPRVARALVVAAETTSQRGRPASKSTLIFGDAAGAFVLERDADRGGRLLGVELLTDAEHTEIMEIDAAGHVRTHLDQKSLNALAAKSFSDASRGVLARAGMTMDQVDWIVPHSGTAGIQATLIKVLDVPPEKVLSNFARVGNVSSAAIPVALDEFVSAGAIRPGQTVLSPTTGTGWYAAAMLYTV